MQKSVLLLLALTITSQTANASRRLLVLGGNVPYKGINFAPANVGRTHAYHMSFRVLVVNVSSIAQSGSIRLLPGSQIDASVISFSGGVFSARAPSIRFSACATSAANANSLAEMTRLSMPFSVAAESFVLLNFSFLGWTTTGTNDTHFYVRFVPFLEMIVDQDRGALKASYLPMSSVYDPTGNPVCDGFTIPSSTPVLPSSAYEYGSEQQLNGDRPF